MTEPKVGVKGAGGTAAKDLHAVPLASAHADGRSSAGASPRLVYLLSRYPAVSHTFFLNEVLALRKLGFDIDVASINRPDRAAEAMPAVEVEESNRTFYVKSAGALRSLLTLVRVLLLHPLVVTRGAFAASRMGGFNLRANLFSLLYLAEALILGDWMLAHGHNRLHVHFGGPVASVGMLTSIAWGIPYSLTIHGPEEFYDVEKYQLRRKVEQADLVLCISNFCRSQLMFITDPSHWDKMRVARLGVDPAVFTSHRKSLDRGRAVEILCVGRLAPQKGQSILIRACAQLKARGGELTVRLVGDGPDRKHLEELAQTEGIDVRFEGAKNHKEVHELLSSADIFALASFAEGVPVALMEAMSMSVPCISTSIAGIPELIRDGMDGLLVPASSVDDLALALGRLIDDPALRESFGAAGRARVISHYNLPLNVQTLAKVFREHCPKQTP